MPGGHDFEARLERVRSAMARSEIDALALSAGPDLLYLIGYEATPLERLTLLVIAAEGGTPTLLIPELEAARAAAAVGVVEMRPWSETEDVIELACQLLTGKRRVAISDRMWSQFLLRLQSTLASVEFVAASSLFGPIRAIKDAGEIGLLAEAASIADDVAAELPDLVSPGMSEREIARMVGRRLLEHGSDRVNFVIVAAGPNSASPHHEPSGRIVESGEMVLLDFGGKKGGYCSDITRMVSIGTPSDEEGEVHDLVQMARDAAFAAAGIGATAGEVDRAARRLIEDAGYGESFIHRTGHGIGLEEHEEPWIVAGDSTRLERGMAFSIEPGIYLPGKFGVRIEDIVTITDDGARSLNNASRALVVVD